jgi:phosphate:Na+ symporter
MKFEQIDIWLLLAGLGLFLYGMNMLEQSLQAFAGRSFKKFIRRFTKGKIQSVLAGAGVTTIMQSSSMVVLLVMSFAGAGIIQLSSGIGMIMGANLGTTITGWIVSLLGFKLDLGQIILPFLALGGLGVIFLKSEKWSNLSKFLMGFSLMFLGLDYMKDGFAYFAANMDLSFLKGQPGIVFLIIGLLLTAAIQSSSAAMLIFLSSLAAGIITLEQGFYLVIGADVGTTVTALLGTVNGNSIKKKVGYAQVFFNVINGILAVLLIHPLGWFVQDVIGMTDPLIALVGFHSSMNLLGILAMLPLIGYLTTILDKKFLSKSDTSLKYLTLANPEEIHSAIEGLKKEALCFLEETIKINKELVTANELNITGNYFKLKQHESEVIPFYRTMLSQRLEEDEIKMVNHLVAVFRNSTHSAKDMKDIKHNLIELSNSASDHIFGFYKKMIENQDKFYRECSTIIEYIDKAGHSELQQLDHLLIGMHNEQQELLFKVLSVHHSEMDVATHLNILKEVNNSNEALLLAIQSYMQID